MKRSFDSSSTPSNATTREQPIIDVLNPELDIVGYNCKRPPALTGEKTKFFFGNRPGETFILTADKKGLKNVPNSTQSEVNISRKPGR